MEIICELQKRVFYVEEEDSTVLETQFKDEKLVSRHLCTEKFLLVAEYKYKVILPEIPQPGRIFCFTKLTGEKWGHPADTIYWDVEEKQFVVVVARLDIERTPGVLFPPVEDLQSPLFAHVEPAWELFYSVTDNKLGKDKSE